MRAFEKISFDQFKKDVKNDRLLYESYHLPRRATKHSVGYDFLAIEDFVIRPNESFVIPTGVKIRFEPLEMCMIVVRSSMGFKYNVRMCNQVGIIECDYYNNPNNEGHAFVKLQNEGHQDFIVKKGEAFAQAIFLNYLITDDDQANEERIGGLGSTTKRGEE